MSPPRGASRVFVMHYMTADLPRDIILSLYWNLIVDAMCPVPSPTGYHTRVLSSSWSNDSLRAQGPDQTRIPASIMKRVHGPWDKFKIHDN